MASSSTGASCFGNGRGGGEGDREIGSEGEDCLRRRREEGGRSGEEEEEVGSEGGPKAASWRGLLGVGVEAETEADRRWRVEGFRRGRKAAKPEADVWDEVDARDEWGDMRDGRDGGRASGESEGRMGRDGTGASGWSSA